ncbi:MAG TPA: phosphate ABC transporter substrate-binding protein PstS [Acidimicrobiales bacterium]|nr:phosphate ABC transporter substrate-binding protein PstS [Acidimicrobiales bacterium]
MKRSTIPVLLAAGALALAACGSSNNSSGSSTNTTAGSGSSGGGASATTASGGGSATTTAPSSATTAPETAPVVHAAITLREDGSSLLFPYLEQVAGAFHKANPKIAVNTGAGGSGLGISDAAAGNTSFGGSDAYLSSTDTSQYQGLINIPVAVSSQAVDYNVPGVKNLKLNGAVLDGMYTGSITNWDDSAIAKLNPGVHLPNLKVAPIHRVDSSGDTFLFTGFLSATNPSTWGTKIGQNTSVTWPSVATAQSASGNPGMVQAAAKTKGAVAYIGISAQSDALKAGLKEAMLQNRAGKFVQPNTATVESAVANTTKVPSNLAVSLLYAPGANSYPIVNFEYIIVEKNQKSATQAGAIRSFLSYVINPKGGSSPTNLAADQFHALPMSVVGKVKAAIASIK